jgi:hypothetical protein
MQTMQKSSHAFGLAATGRKSALSKPSTFGTGMMFATVPCCSGEVAGSNNPMREP